MDGQESCKTVNVQMFSFCLCWDSGLLTVLWIQVAVGTLFIPHAISGLEINVLVSQRNLPLTEYSHSFSTYG